MAVVRLLSPAAPAAPAAPPVRPAAQVVPAEVRTPAASALSAAVRRAAPALALYTAIRALGVAVLFVWSGFTGRNPWVLLSERWDSLWYTRIAEHGYAFAVQAPDGRHLSSMAFFPLFPWLEQTVSAVTRLSAPHAGLLVSLLASVAAAWGIFALADRTYGRRAATVLVVLWAALPVGIVQSMAYSESLFVALAAWSLYAAVTHRWITAGLLASLAGLTRPVGLAVAAALLVAAFCAWRTARPAVPPAPGRRARAVLGCLIAPLGAASYILWVGWERGALFGYLDVQGEWGNGFDAGIAFARFVAASMGAGAWAGVLVLLAVVLLSVWPHWLGLRQRVPVPLVVYSAVVTLLAVGASGYFGSKPRLLLPAFPILFPLALALARARPARAATLLTVLVALSAAYGAFWLNGSGPP
ncbi:glycosyltransferase family 39 protein [Streptomyces sp. 549]|uniref:glycosyltransferase family 39 protein n=1 Tax=Streptomyces sp. 549 TaxID=3049076 RepID=UPI0024C35CF9|nr:glycosyltransferase family 39 protein [Streptomyces sp. 549]MDK1472477.1 glycosyltransferase family 39 protein [Streptomyces sp. 549]